MLGTHLRFFFDLFVLRRSCPSALRWVGSLGRSRGGLLAASTPDGATLFEEARGSGTDAQAVGPRLAGVPVSRKPLLVNQAMSKKDKLLKDAQSRPVSHADT